MAFPSYLMDRQSYLYPLPPPHALRKQSPVSHRVFDRHGSPQVPPSLFIAPGLGPGLCQKTSSVLFLSLGAVEDSSILGQLQIKSSAYALEPRSSPSLSRFPRWIASTRQPRS